MNQNSVSFALISSVVLFAVFVGVGSVLLPSWGKLQVTPVHSITVIGEAKSQEKSQIASFTAGVNAFGDDKNVAVDDVNKKVAAIIEAVKGFGVPAADIKTQSLNIYQQQEQYYEDGRQKMRPGQWNVGNTIEIKLMDVDRASALSELLTKSGATTVYGPNFTLDDTSAAATALFDAALSNANDKAQTVAQSTGRSLGKVINITEGSTSSPILYRMESGGGGGGGAIEPGSGMVSKSVTVTYELK